MDFHRLHVRPGRKVNLRRYDPADTRPFHDKRKATGVLDRGLQRLVALQGRLYAHHRWAMLLIFQGIDASGKDGAIKHVMSGLNPQGTQVFSFKRPSDEELDHDYLWRAVKALPERGRIGIFNRSYFEEVLVVRVHPEILDGEKLPAPLVTRHVWKNRYEDINAFERHLARNGTLVLKFHLRISKEEQRKRFLARLKVASKRWKFSASDIAERAYWDDYMAAYEEMIRETSTDYAPWYVIPADHKHVAWVIVSAAIVEAIEALKPDFPKITGKALKDLKKAERELRAEG